MDFPMQKLFRIMKTNCPGEALTIGILAVNVGRGGDKRLYVTRFETVHHSLKKETLYKMFDAIVPEHFESKLSEQAVNFSDEARSELDFIKECLTSDVWGGCSRWSCPVYEHQEKTQKYLNPHFFMLSKSL